MLQIKLDEEYRKKFGELGINEDDLAYYFKTFIPNGTKYRIQYLNGVNWYQKEEAINTPLLYGHFTHSFQLSTLPWNTTCFALFDLDAYKGIKERYWSLVETFGKPSFVFQSSLIKQEEDCELQGGLHVYYMLQENLSTKKLFEGLKNFAKSNGIIIESGKVEVFPNPSFSIRLPIHNSGFTGRYAKYPLGGNLICPERIEFQMMNNQEPFTFADTFKHIRNSTMHDFSKYLQYNASKQFPVTVPVKDFETLSTNVQGRGIVTYSELPVVTKGSRNSTWLVWVRNFWKQGLDDAQIESTIIKLMDSAEMNAGSLTWERDRNAAIKHLRDMIKNWRKKQGVPRSSKREPFHTFDDLSIEEVKTILRYSLKSDKTYDLKIAKFLFKLMAFCKHKLAIGVTENPLPYQFFSNLRNVRTRFDNPRYLQKAFDIGFISIKNKAISSETGLGKAAVYSYHTNGLSPSVKGFSSLDSALRELIPANQDDFRRRLPRRVYNSLRKGV